MKKVLYFLLLFITCRASAQEESFVVYQVDPLVKVLKERNYFRDQTDTIRVARGETATIQLVIRANKDINRLSADVGDISDRSFSLQQHEIRWVGYVKVGRKYKSPSKDILRSASGYFPDPLFDDTTMSMHQGEVEPLWVSVPVPLNAAPGVYKGTVTISGRGRRRAALKKVFYIRVYPVSVPQTSLWVTNWMSFAPGNLAYMNNGKPVETFSPLYWNLLGKFALMAGSHGQNMYRIYPVWLTRYMFNSKGEYQFDFSNFDKEVELFEKEGNLKRIEGGHLAWRSGKWSDPYFVEVPVKDKKSTDLSAPGASNAIESNGFHFVKLPLSDARAKKFLAQFLPALKSHLLEKGWLGQYVQHIGDEPVDSNAESYKAISEYVRKYLPGVKIVDAVTASKSLSGSIDIWCPVLDLFGRDYSFFEKLRKQGKEIWFYTCVIPQGNYANRFIELPLVQTRILHWIDFKYHATGYLHWGFNFWSGFDDPLRETARHRGMLPGGDCFIVYPGYHKLYSSIRLEAMRDGIYDYELLKMLQRKDPEKAKAIVGSIVLNFNEYDSEVHHFREMRKELLEALSIKG
jgi:hypothetical protein